MWFLAIFLTMAFLCSTAFGFSIQSHLPAMAASPIPPGGCSPSQPSKSTIVFMAPSDDNGDKSLNQELRTEEEESITGEEKEESPLVKKIARGSYLLYTYTTTFIGILLSFGLVLNLLGYGYIWQDGSIRIDTIQQLRQERQFQRVSRGLEDP